MYARLRVSPSAVTVAALLLAFVPYAAQAEERIEGEETDHSNQDMVRPDTRILPCPGSRPGTWDGPQSHPDLGEPGGALDPLSIGGMGRLHVGDLAKPFDPNEVLSRILGTPDSGPVPPAPFGPDERFIDWSLPLGGPGVWPDLAGIGNDGWGPPAPIPEPGTLSLLLLGGALVAAGRRRG